MTDQTDHPTCDHRADPVQAVAEVLANEGCLPGHSIHSWRCEDRERYPEPCTCVEELAAEVVAAALPLIESERINRAQRDHDRIYDECQELRARLAAVEALREAADSGRVDAASCLWLHHRADQIEADE